MNDPIDDPPATEITNPLRRALSIATLALFLLLIPLSAAHGLGCELPDPCSRDGVRGVILTGGHVVDYKNGWDGKRDIVFSCPRDEDGSPAGGRITHVSGEGQPLGGVAKYFRVDASELLILPGHVDSHVHLAYDTYDTRDPGTPYRRGLEALVANGVTTALDVGSIPGTLTQVLEKDGEGVGLTVGSLYGLRPNGTIPEKGAVDPESGAEVDCGEFLEIEDGTENDDPSYETLKAVLHCALEQGALGFKVLSGHYPLTPEAVKSAIRVSNEESAYVALHVGSTKCRSNLYGFQEALGMLIDLHRENACLGRAHIAHVNAYARGQTRPDLDEESPLQEEEDPEECLLEGEEPVCSREDEDCAEREARKIEELLDRHRKLVVSEIHLADFSFGDAWQDEEGALTDQVTVNNLDQMCFKPEEEGVPPGPEDLEEAIRSGAVGVLEGKTLEIERCKEAEGWRRRCQEKKPCPAPVDGETCRALDLYKKFAENPRKDQFKIEKAVRAVFYLYDTDVSNAMATRSREDGGPTVEAIASDGGLLPRNVNCQRAYRLYRPDPSGATGPRLSGPMLAAKLSYFPARMLGLVWSGPGEERPARRPDKGHLSVGADADLTLLYHPGDPRAPAARDRADLAPGDPVMAFSEGRRTMYRGKACRLERRRPVLLVTEAGVETLENKELDYRVVDLARNSLLYRKAFE